jgi:hypothetical protein
MAGRVEKLLKSYEALIPPTLARCSILKNRSANCGGSGGGAVIETSWSVHLPKEEKNLTTVRHVFVSSDLSCVSSSSAPAASE